MKHNSRGATGQVQSRIALNEAKPPLESFGHPFEGILSEEHGFLPKKPPLQEMDKEHKAWDELAAELPELFARCEFRNMADQSLPLLSAEKDDLEEGYLCRAAALLGTFAHAYALNGATWDGQLPDCIETPWALVCRRLNRPTTSLTFQDSVIYNWKQRDPNASDPRSMDNLDLLIPVFGNQEERIFFLTFTEMLDRCTPIIGASVRAQEAVLKQDHDALYCELIIVMEAIKEMIRSLLKQSLNTYNKNYIDPIIWSKTAAVFNSSIREGELGLSGASSTNIVLLDIFLGRISYRTEIGHQSVQLYSHLPYNFRQFFDALKKMSVRTYALSSSDQYLKNLFQQVLHTYAGDSGLLGVHRRRVYGIMDVGFKSGRTETNAGFSGDVGHHAWEQLDHNLDVARLERFTGYKLDYPWAKITNVVPIGKTASKVTFDIHDAGIHYQAGDRCEIYVENNDELIEKTLRSFRARENDLISISKAWQVELKSRLHRIVGDTLPFKEFLRYAKIRPATRDIAKQLQRLTGSLQLKKIINDYREDQYELWNLIDILVEENYDIKHLWVSKAWEAENISRIVPPDSPRVYSVSSSPVPDSSGQPKKVDFTVGYYSYEAKTKPNEAPLVCSGVGSVFLTSEERKSPNLCIKMKHPIYFSLPKETDRPIVMFAGGTGIAPCRAFMQQRIEQKASGKNILFFSIRSIDNFFYKDEFEQYAAAGELDCHIIVSGEAKKIDFKSTQDGGKFIIEKASPERIDDRLQDPKITEKLWNLLKDEKSGGKGAIFYICGQAPFANTILLSLKSIIKRHMSTTVPAEEDQIERFFYQLVGDRRLRLDIFTTQGPSIVPGVRTIEFFSISEVIKHNNSEKGFWMIIDDVVYDLTLYHHFHPGGEKIIKSYSGVDGTRAFNNIGHNLHPEVFALLDMYKTGFIKNLDFQDEWSIALSETTVRYVSLQQLYEHWLGLLYETVELENAFANNYGIRYYSKEKVLKPFTANEAKILLELHQYFMEQYCAIVAGDQLNTLWAEIIGFADHTESIVTLRNQVEILKDSPQLQQLNQRYSDLIELLYQSKSPQRNRLLAKFPDFCERLIEGDRNLLVATKDLLVAGLKMFEQSQEKVIRRCGKQLVELILKLPKNCHTYLNLMLDIKIE